MMGLERPTTRRSTADRNRRLLRVDVFKASLRLLSSCLLPYADCDHARAF